MAFDIVGVVQSEIRRPIAWLGQVQDGPQKRRIISPHFQWGDFHFRPVGQLGLRRQHHHAVLDCAFEAHADCLTQDARQRKPSRNQGWQKTGTAKYAEHAEEGRPPRLLSAYSAFRGEPLPLLPATCPVVSSAVKVPAMIYLDHNATTTVLPEVFEAMRPYFCEDWGNPSSSYKFGSKLKAVIETARAQVAELIRARPTEIMFTH